MGGGGTGAGGVPAEGGGTCVVGGASIAPQQCGEVGMAVPHTQVCSGVLRKCGSGVQPLARAMQSINGRAGMSIQMVKSSDNAVRRLRLWALEPAILGLNFSAVTGKLCDFWQVA